jgi:hypothetical protein
MNEKAQNTGLQREATERMVDLRNVMVDEDTDLKIDEYVLNQRKQGKRGVKKGQAAVDLIKKGLKAEGIE